MFTFFTSKHDGIGANVVPASQVCATTMLFLRTIWNYIIRIW